MVLHCVTLAKLQISFWLFDTFQCFSACRQAHKWAQVVKVLKANKFAVKKKKLAKTKIYDNITLIPKLTLDPCDAQVKNTEPRHVKCM
jgi:hypothetical protein